MKKRLDKWRQAGFHFKLELLLRCITTILTGEALFAELGTWTRRGSGTASARRRAVDGLLNLIGARLGLDHDRVLGSRYSFPLMARYLDERKFRLDGPARAGSTPLLVCAYLPLGPLCGIDRDRAQPGPRADRTTGWRARTADRGAGRNRGDLQLQPNDFSAGARARGFTRSCT